MTAPTLARLTGPASPSQPAAAMRIRPYQKWWKWIPDCSTTTLGRKYVNILAAANDGMNERRATAESYGLPDGLSLAVLSSFKPGTHSPFYRQHGKFRTDLLLNNQTISKPRH